MLEQKALPALIEKEPANLLPSDVALAFFSPVKISAQ